MFTRIEIDGFKSFRSFAVDMHPFSVIVGPNAAGKSNLFDAIRFLSRLAQDDVSEAMRGLRGEPDELFRREGNGTVDTMSFAVEVVLPAEGEDDVGTTYKISDRRLRYELVLELEGSDKRRQRGVYVARESCVPIAKSQDRVGALARNSTLGRRRRSPFIATMGEGDEATVEIRQDGFATSGNASRGRPVSYPAYKASATALSTIRRADFPHLYALRDLLTGTQFLEINPAAARRPSDAYASRSLSPDASNLAAVLLNIKRMTATSDRPEGFLPDIAADLSSIIQGVCGLKVVDDERSREISFLLDTNAGETYSARVISDGTLRILALITALNDPNRRGVLCFEEPENGVHEQRVPYLIDLLRYACTDYDSDELNLRPFQIVMNSHSPVVLSELRDSEVIAARLVTVTRGNGHLSRVTNMRTLSPGQDLFERSSHLTRSELDSLLRREPADAP